MLICLISGICPILIWRKVKNIENVRLLKYIKSIIVNFVLTVLCYSYYIGYSKEAYTAAFFELSPNFLYFAVISFLIAALQTVYYLKKADDKKYIKRICRIENDEKILFWVCMLIAFLVRVIAFDWGSKDALFCADEGQVIRIAREMALNNTMMSSATFYPSQISHKILAVVYKVYYLICGVLELEFSELICAYIARIYIAIISTGIVGCVYFIGNDLKRHAGLVACAITAVFPCFVQVAHNVRGDTVVVFIMCLTMIRALIYLNSDEEFKNLFVMCILSAMAGLEKYNGIALCGLIAITVIAKQCRNGKIEWKRIFVQGFFAVFCVIVTIAVISPNLITKINEIVVAMDHVANGYEADGNNSFVDNLREYISIFLSNSGIICLPFGLYGIYILIKNKCKDAIILNIGLIFLIGMCIQNRAFTRWGYPYFVCFIILIGIGIVEFISKKDNNKFFIAVKYSLFAVIIVNCLSETVMIDSMLVNSNQDTRVVSEEWCISENIRLEDCIYDNYTCFRPGGYYSKYKYEYVSLENNLIYENGDLIVDGLGRKYAILNKRYYNENADKLKNLDIVKVFDSDLEVDGGMYKEYRTFSKKILEPYSIYDSIKTTYQILTDKIYTGWDTSIYDISSLTAFQKFDIQYSESCINDNKYQIVSKITSIDEGKYSIEIKGSNDKNMIIIFTDDSGSEICRAEDLFTNDKTYFEMPKHYYNINMVIMSDVEDAYESVIIRTINP